MFIITVILTDLFLLLLLSIKFGLIQPFYMSHHKCGFCNDMLFYCILLYQASELAKIATFTLNSSHSISSFKIIKTVSSTDSVFYYPF